MYFIIKGPSDKKFLREWSKGSQWNYFSCCCWK